MAQLHFIRWFREIGLGDVGLVGGKNASLGEMYRELTPRGINIPNGFGNNILDRPGDFVIMSA
ncbi:MAG: hypothetical protein AB7P69_26115 [Candidatus Binatia bacterium]